MADELTKTRAENAAMISKISEKDPKFSEAYNNSLTSGKSSTEALDDAIADKESRSKQASEQKKTSVQCPTCSGKMLVNDYKQKEETLEGYTGNTGFAARIPIIGALFKGPKDKQSLFDKKCPTCEGKAELEDKTDQTKQTQKAAEVAQKESKEILELESKLGPLGGNRHQLIVGDDMLEIGLGFNDSKSYKVVKEGQVSPSGGKIESKATIPVYKKSSSVVGTNPLATPGGHYHIKCSNQFSVFTGAQGINLTSVGPVTIKGGITQIIGPEVTIGSSVGPISLEGDHVQITGKSIALTPDPAGNGQVTVQGTMHTAGNAIIGGGAHIDGDLSFNSATCPGRVERSRVSSDPNQVTGPAQWSYTGAANALTDFIRKVTVQLADPTSVLLSPRGMKNIQQEAMSLAKKALPIETQPTGVILPGQCVVVGANGTSTNPAPIPIYNFPHHHTLADGAHSHDSFVPNIKLMNSSDEVRKNAKQKEAIAPVGISEPGGNIFSKMGSSILGVLSLRVNP
jgi:hypothetical protein